MRILSIFTLIFLTGCASLMGSLRKDLDDGQSNAEPTVGGVWPEGGLLDNPYGGPYASVGHRDDRNASNQSVYYSDDATWVREENEIAARRDAYRSQPSFSQNQNIAPPTDRQYQSRRTKREDFIDRSQTTGSLWASHGQTNYYFTKNRIRDVGDLITMEMEQPLVEDVAAEVKKGLSPGERDVEMAFAQEKIKSDAVKDRKPAANKKGEKQEEPEIREATNADIDVKDSMAVKAGDQMMLEIVDRYPNGHYKVRGTKRVPYRGTLRTMALIGIAKSSDVNDQDKIASGKLYEYRLKVYR